MGSNLIYVLVILGLCRWAAGLVEDASFSFSFQDFKEAPGAEPGITLFGDAAVVNGSVRLSRGRVMYRRRLAFGRKPSFSSHFCFSISPKKGHGLVFLMAPTSISLEEGPTAGVFAVEFAGDRVGVSLGAGGAAVVAELSEHGVALGGREKVHGWVDYGGDSRVLRVGLGQGRSPGPLVSHPVDLSGLIWKNSMAVGFAASSGNSTQTAALYAWDFSLKHAAAYLMHSEPLDPRPILNPPARPGDHLRRDYLPAVLVGLAFGAFCGALVIVLLLSVWITCFYRRALRPAEYSVHPFDCDNEKIPPPAKP
ncbi:L-type lectin-domain containing receptor kinase VIII.2-like [Wolffia australiana]